MGTRAVQVFCLLGMERRGEVRDPGVITLCGGPVSVKHYKQIIPPGVCLNTSKMRGISLSIDPEILRERERDC